MQRDQANGAVILMVLAMMALSFPPRAQGQNKLAGAPSSGAAGRPAFVDLFGDGTSGTLGEPHLSISELPTIPTHRPLRLDADLACPQSPVLFVVGSTGDRPGGFPFGGRDLLVAPRWLLPATTDAHGHGEFALADVPRDPTLSGLELFAQALIDDPLGPDGVALTRGLELRLGD